MAVVEPLSPEKSYVMIKPDGVQRGLVGRIIQRFEVEAWGGGAIEISIEFSTLIPTTPQIAYRVTAYRVDSAYRLGFYLEPNHFRCLYI